MIIDERLLDNARRVAARTGRQDLREIVTAAEALQAGRPAQLSAEFVVRALQACGQSS